MPFAPPPPPHDDKAKYCIPFILDQWTAHRNRHANSSIIPPFFLGLNGVQGAGKTTLVSALSASLATPPTSLNVAVFSIDDLYLTHADQCALASANPDNALLQHRGQPGTHDLTLASDLLQALRHRESARIPSYDKSAFSGQGDRVDPGTWSEVNAQGQPSVDLIIVEGWCVGFRALEEDVLKTKWEKACVEKNDQSRLWRHQLQHLQAVNDALRAYDILTDQLHAFIHIDALDLQYVYEWRQQQEEALRKTRGSGMTIDQVKSFVDGYYPAYELYTDQLGKGTLSCPDETTGPELHRHLRIIIGKDRQVIDVAKPSSSPVLIVIQSEPLARIE